jgi:hypothetical protein
LIAATISPPIYGRRAFSRRDAARGRGQRYATSARRQRGAHAQARGARWCWRARAPLFSIFFAIFAEAVFADAVSITTPCRFAIYFHFIFVFILPPAISFFHAILLTPLSLLLSACRCHCRR